MKALSTKLERLSIGLVLTLAVLTFLSPLVRLRGPGGDMPGDGYHLRADLAQLQNMLTTLSTVPLSDSSSAAGSSRADVSSPAQSSQMPSSVQMSWLTPWLIYASFACACLALVGLVTAPRLVGKLSLAGGCVAALAMVHVILMGSDLQAWATRALNNGVLTSGDGVIMVTRLLVVNSFQVSPGIGLLGLASCLLLASFISSTSAISRIKSVVRREQRYPVSQPVRVRPLHPNYSVETCTSVDLSRSGLLLESASDHYYVGMEVYVTRDPGTGGQTDAEEHGSIVRVEQRDGGKSRFAISIFSHDQRDAVTGLAARQEHKSRHPIEFPTNSR